MKQLLFTLLTTLGIFSLVAQNNNANNYLATVFIDHVNRIGSNNLDYLPDDYKGSPYNNPIFLLGTIYKNDEIVVSNYALRYNAIADEIEVKETLYTKDADMKALTKSPDLYVKIMNDLFVFAPANEEIEKAGYFQVLYVGTNYHLYKKISKKYFPPKKAKNSFEQDIPADFADRSSYYLVSKVGEFQKFESSKSKKFKVFGDKQPAIKKYASKGKMDLSSENDLIKVVRYYDAISESKEDAK